jgi:hypothetical protein
MTLKEKFETKSSIDTTKEAKVFAKECEDIADEFAIGFADWIRVCRLKGRPYNFENIKELLEIYKDEKDL